MRPAAPVLLASFFDHMDELSLHSWSHFGRSTTPGKVPHSDTGCDCGLLESPNLRNSSVTFRLAGFSHMVSQLFLKVSGGWQILQSGQTGSVSVVSYGGRDLLSLLNVLAFRET